MSVDSLGPKIRAARQAAGLTQRQLAKQLGTSASAVTQWETGVSAPSLHHTKKTEEILGLPQGSLVFSENDAEVFVSAHASVMLRQLRERAGLSLEALALRAGYRHASGLQRYENPEEYTKQYLPLDLTRKLASALVGRGTPPITPSEVFRGLVGIDAPHAFGTVETLERQQAEARAYIDLVTQATGWTTTEIARRAGIAPSTINRFKNKDVPFSISIKTLSRIGEISGVAIPPAVFDAYEITTSRPAIDIAWFERTLGARDLTKTALAMVIGIHASALSNVLNGSRQLRRSEARAIAKAFECPLSDVLAAFAQDEDDQLPYEMVHSEFSMLAGDVKFDAYRVRNPEIGEFGGLQFHMTVSGTVIAVMGEEMAKLFIRLAGDCLASKQNPEPR